MELAICLVQGVTFSFPIHYTEIDNTPIDITGYTVLMQIRESIDSEDVLLEASTENGRVTIDGENGIIQITISKEDTAELDVLSNGVYDILVTDPNGDCKQLVKGSVSIQKAVSRVEPD